MSHSQFHCKTLTLRHAWLSLWDKHMTTGRINQITYAVTSPEESYFLASIRIATRRMTTGFSFPTRPQLDHTDHRPSGTSRALSGRCSPHAGRDRTCQSTHSQASAQLKDFQHYAFFSIQQPLSPIAGLQVRKSAHRTSATCHKNFGGCSLSGDSQKSFKFLIAFSCHDCSQLPLIYRKSPSP